MCDFFPAMCLELGAWIFSLAVRIIRQEKAIAVQVELVFRIGVLYTAAQFRSKIGARVPVAPFEKRPSMFHRHHRD